MKFSDVADAVLKGEFDDRLDDFLQLVKERRQLQARKMFYEIEPGDRVRFVQGVRPKYLAGKTGILKARLDKNVQVQLEDGPVGRFGGIITTPCTLIEKA
jgi:ribosomal protein L21E